MTTEMTKNPYGPDCAILNAVICHTVGVLVEAKKDFTAEALLEQWRRIKEFLQNTDLEKPFDADATPLNTMSSTVFMAITVLEEEGIREQGAVLRNAWVRFSDSLVVKLLNGSQN